MNRPHYIERLLDIAEAMKCADPKSHDAQTIADAAAMLAVLENDDHRLDWLAVTYGATLNGLIDHDGESLRENIDKAAGTWPWSPGGDTPEDTIREMKRLESLPESEDDL